MCNHPYELVLETTRFYCRKMDIYVYIYFLIENFYFTFNYKRVHQFTYITISPNLFVILLHYLFIRKSNFCFHHYWHGCKREIQNYQTFSSFRVFSTTQISSFWMNDMPCPFLHITNGLKVIYTRHSPVFSIAGKGLEKMFIFQIRKLIIFRYINFFDERSYVSSS